MLSLAAFALVCAFFSLTAGGATSYITNVLFATRCNQCDVDETFRKPMWVTLLVFIGPALTSCVMLMLFPGLRADHSSMAPPTMEAGSKTLGSAQAVAAAGTPSGGAGAASGSASTPAASTGTSSSIIVRASSVREAATPLSASMAATGWSSSPRRRQLAGGAATSSTAANMEALELGDAAADVTRIRASSSMNSSTAAAAGAPSPSLRIGATPRAGAMGSAPSSPVAPVSAPAAPGTAVGDVSIFAPAQREEATHEEAPHRGLLHALSRPEKDGGARGGGTSQPASFGDAAWRAKVMSIFMRFMRPLLTVAVLDVSTTFLQSAASMFIPAAINAAMRGTLLIITAVLNRRFGVSDASASREEWKGIYVSTLGVAIIGVTHIVASALDPNKSNSATSSTDTSVGTAILYAVIGVTLSLASNVTLASCVVFETKALETKSFSPTEVNGLKSALGAVLIIVSLAAFQVLPIQRDHGVFENSVHTVCCMATTPLLLALTLVVAASASLSSINAMYLSLLRGSNFRALIYVGRALFVWILQLLVYYLGYARRDAISMAYGESWGVYSWAELAGFATMVLGGGITWRAKSRRM